MKHKKIKDAFDDPSIKVPFFEPLITAEDKKAVSNTLNATLLTDGPILRKFESEFARFCGIKYAIGVSNATVALQLSLKALGISKGDEVIIPDLTFVATASSVLLSGATPVLADVEKDSFNISPISIENSITSKTKAILPVHFAGRPCNMHKLTQIARSNNLMIIEDCAHSLGAKYGSKYTGTFGDTGCFSFYPTKNFTTIEGGMIITNNKQIFEYVKKARNHGISKSLKDRFSYGKPWDYDVLEPGYNYRLDEVRSSLGLSQIKRLKKMNLLREKACKYYNDKLQHIKGIKTPLSNKRNKNSYHLYVIRITKEYGMSRDQLFQKLLKKGIRTSVHYKPLHLFTAFKKFAKIYHTLENTKLIYNEILSLPLYPSITRKAQDYVIKNLRQ